jgi:hypothetical protein
MKRCYNLLDVALAKPRQAPGRVPSRQAEAVSHLPKPPMTTKDDGLAVTCPTRHSRHRPVTRRTFYCPYIASTRLTSPIAGLSTG